MEAYIVGGGNSLQNFDFKALKDKNTIAVNKAIFYVPKPNYFVTMDYTFLKKMGKEANSFKGIQADKIFVVNYSTGAVKNIGGYIKDVKCNLVYDLRYFNMTLKSFNEKGLGLNFNEFHHGDNSGFCAFQFAVCMKFNPIYLLGIDLKVKHGQTHFHGGYGDRPHSFNKRLIRYYDNWKEGIQIANQNGTEVYSCSPKSKLNNVVPYREFKDIK